MKNSEVMKNLKKGLLLAAMVIVAGMATAGQKYNIYLGTTHSHCNFSGDVVAGAQKAGRELDPKNDVDQCIIAARDNGFQFYAVTDHSQYDCYTPAAWASVGEWANKLTEDGKFVALRGFEFSRNDNTDGKGHMNVYNTPNFVSAALDAYDLHKFQDWLTLPENRDAIVCFNHPEKGAYNNFAIYNPAAKSHFALQELINSDNPKDYYQRWLESLALGFKVSPVAGLDNHNYQKIPKAISRTGVAATELTQKGILDAFAARRTYATMDKELKAFYTVDGQPMGSTLTKPKGDLKFAIEMSTPNKAISRVEIVTEGGKVVSSKDFASGEVKWDTSVPQGNKYYFLIVYNSDGPVAWIAPVWIE